MILTGEPATTGRPTTQRPTTRKPVTNNGKEYSEKDSQKLIISPQNGRHRQVLTATKGEEETQSYQILIRVVSVLLSARQLVTQTPHAKGLSGEQQMDKDQEYAIGGRILSSVDV